MTELAKKVRYCLQMMELVTAIHEIIDDEYYRRIVARIHFIYLDAFVKLVRQLKNSVRNAGYDVRDVERLIKILDDEYERWYAPIRDVLAAHRQDEPLGQLIEQWSEIAEYSLAIFTGDCLEIYRLLHGAGNTIDPYVGSADLSKIPTAFADLNKTDDSQHAVFAGDTLAITREDTLVTLPVGPLQTCTSRIISVLDMLYITRDIHGRIEETPDVDRLLKASAIVDACSFLDALAPAASPNPHASPNLLELIAGDRIINGAALSNGLTALDEGKVQRIRTARKKIGAHVDQAADLDALLGLLDALTIEDVFEAINPAIDGFDQLCGDNKNMFLSHHMQRRPLPKGVTIYKGDRKMGEDGIVRPV